MKDLSTKDVIVKEEKESLEGELAKKCIEWMLTGWTKNILRGDSKMNLQK